MNIKTAQDYCGEIANYLEANPDAWGKGTLAWSRDGVAVPPRDPTAISWCVLGLIDHFVDLLSMRQCCWDLLARVVTPLGKEQPYSIHRYNDAERRTLTDIVRLFRAASFMPDIDPALDFFGGQPVSAHKLSEATVVQLANDFAKDLAKEFAEIQPMPALLLTPPPDWFKIASATANHLKDAPPAWWWGKAMSEKCAA